MSSSVFTTTCFVLHHVSFFKCVKKTYTDINRVSIASYVESWLSAETVGKQPVFLAIDWCGVISSLILKSVTTGMSVKTLKHITVDERNYLALKRLGSAGDSFNDVISRLLKKSTTWEPEEKEEEDIE